MDNSLDFIYSIFDISSIKHKYLKKKDIYKYIILHIFILTNYDSKKSIINVMSITVDFENYIKNGYFYERKYITINKKNERFLEYIDKKNKCNDAIINSVLLLNRTVVDVKKSNSTDKYDEHSKEDDSDQSTISEHDENSDQSTISEHDENSDQSTISEHDENSDQSNIYEKHDENQKKIINNLNVKEDTIDEDINKVYIFGSLTHDNKFYFINEKLTSCSCESYKYCKLSTKNCKHLEELNDNLNNNHLLIIDKIKKSCNCTRFVTHESCKHITKYNNSIIYLNEIGI